MRCGPVQMESSGLRSVFSVFVNTDIVLERPVSLPDPSVMHRAQDQEPG